MVIVLFVIVQYSEIFDRIFFTRNRYRAGLVKMISSVVILLLLGVVSSYARPSEFNPDNQSHSLPLIRPNKPTFPRNMDDLGLVDMHQLIDPVYQRNKRSPQDGEKNSVSMTASRTEAQKGGMPAYNSLRGDYSYNLWRGGKDGATVDANTFYQRNWGAGPKHDYGGGISLSVPFGRG